MRLAPTFFVVPVFGSFYSEYKYVTLAENLALLLSAFSIHPVDLALPTPPSNSTRKQLTANIATQRKTSSFFDGNVPSSDISGIFSAFNALARSYTVLSRSVRTLAR